MNDEMNFFSEIDEMNAELNDVWGSRNRKRSRRRPTIDDETTDIPNESTGDVPDGRSEMLQEIEELKRSNDPPGDLRFDLTVKQEGNRRGERVPKEQYDGLSFGSLYDVITKKYR